MAYFNHQFIVEIPEDDDILKFGHYILARSIDELKLIKKELEIRIDRLTRASQRFEGTYGDELKREFDKIQKVNKERLQSVNAMLNLRIKDEEEKRDLEIQRGVVNPFLRLSPEDRQKLANELQLLRQQKKK